MLESSYAAHSGKQRLRSRKVIEDCQYACVKIFDALTCSFQMHRNQRLDFETALVLILVVSITVNHQRLLSVERYLDHQFRSLVTFTESQDSDGLIVSSWLVIPFDPLYVSAITLDAFVRVLKSVRLGVRPGLS